MPVLQEERVGYLIGNDQYFKRDDVGIIYQINIAESHRRSLVGAMLLKAQFERSAYGCRLYCCWCAQDIEANHFWESLGFTPLAFRAGSRGKGRVHIFWQRRIREGDTSTPYWFPSQTSSGAIREDRLVLPIPPGTHWSDVKPIILPGAPAAGDAPQRALPEATNASHKRRDTRATRDPMARALQGFSFAAAPIAAAASASPAAKPARPKKQRLKNDPRYIAAARELRDRWLERVNEDPSLLLPGGKYDVTRALIEPVNPPLPMQIAPALPPLPMPALPGSTTSTSSGQASSPRAAA